jgi:hypothetical protein
MEKNVNYSKELLYLVPALTEPVQTSNVKKIQSFRVLNEASCCPEEQQATNQGLSALTTNARLTLYIAMEWPAGYLCLSLAASRKLRADTVGCIPGRSSQLSPIQHRQQQEKRTSVTHY